MNQSDIMLESLVRGALVDEFKTPTLSGDGDITDEILMARTLDGLADGSVAPLSEGDFDREMNLLLNDPAMAGIFSKLKRKLKRVAAKVRKAGRKIRKSSVMRNLKRGVKRVAKKLKPIIKKAAAVGLAVTGANFAMPYIKKGIGLVKGKFKSAAGKKAYVKRLIDKAPPQARPALQRVANEVDREMRQEIARARSGGFYNQYARNARVETRRAKIEQTPAISLDTLKDLARIKATEYLAKKGINIQSPDGHRMMDQVIQEQPLPRQVQQTGAIEKPVNWGVAMIPAGILALTMAA